MSFDQNRTQALTDHRRRGVVVSLRSMNGTEYPLDLSLRKWVVGSSESCDIVVEDPFVSSAHCTLERKASGALLVRDRQSRNGTYVDSNSIEAGELRAGAHLVIGKTTLVAEAAAGKEPASALEMMRGRDPVLLTAIDQALKAADRDCNVLVVGETGTGKDLLARIIHESSRRAAANFVTVNCGAIPRELIGSELFGHERGAFTGAERAHAGIFERANGGTLLLDELGDLPLAAQTKLLRVMQERTVRRVGGTQEIALDVRVIAATHRDLRGESFREDLYYRLAVFQIEVPPLRDRHEDIAPLAAALIGELSRDPVPLSARDLAVLETYDWPGNVRELRNVLETMLVIGELPVLAGRAEVHANTSLDAATREAIEGALRATRGKIYGATGAAARLGLPPATLQSKMKRLGIDRARFT